MCEKNNKDRMLKFYWVPRKTLICCWTYFSQVLLLGIFHPSASSLALTRFSVTVGSLQVIQRSKICFWTFFTTSSCRIPVTPDFSFNKFSWFRMHHTTSPFVSSFQHEYLYNSPRIGQIILDLYFFGHFCLFWNFCFDFLTYFDSKGESAFLSTDKT